MFNGNITIFHGKINYLTMAFYPCRKLSNSLPEASWRPWWEPKGSRIFSQWPWTCSKWNSQSLKATSFSSCTSGIVSSALWDHSFRCFHRGTIILGETPENINPRAWVPHKSMEIPIYFYRPKSPIPGDFDDFLAVTSSTSASQQPKKVTIAPCRPCACRSGDRVPHCSTSKKMEVDQRKKDQKDQWDFDQFKIRIWPADQQKVEFK